MTSIWAIPSPDQGVWYLGPVPLRAYALAIILGIVAAIWIGERRWVARGGKPGEISDLAIWAVPFGMVGGRLYHVITDWEDYFGPGDSPVEALYVWQGGLGVWGAISLGALGVVLGARRKKIRILPVLDAIAPGILVAQGIGRWGNYFNQELYGSRTGLPWALEIDQFAPSGEVIGHTYHHPTFLSEFLWCLAAFALVVWADRRFRLGHGQVVALYVMTYTAGRGWIEMLRVDPVQMNDVLGLRLNVWTSIVLFVLAAAYFVSSRRTHRSRETSVYAGQPPAQERLSP